MSGLWGSSTLVSIAPENKVEALTRGLPSVASYLLDMSYLYCFLLQGKLWAILEGNPKFVKKPSLLSLI